MRAIGFATVHYQSKQGFDGYKGLTSDVGRESLHTRFYTKHPHNMNTCIRRNPFSETHMGITKCFCGNLTVEDHDFCFCSPECARADAMVSLGGEDSHYRKVVRKAYVRCGAPVPAIYRRKTEEKTPIAKHVPAILRPVNTTHQCNKQNTGGQNDGSAKKEKVFPTLAQVTSAVLARKAKQGGEAAVEPAAKTSQFAAQISLNALPISPPLPNQQIRPGLDRSAHKPPLARLRSAPQQTMPLKVNEKTVIFRSQPSMLHPVAEARGRKNGDDTPLLRMLDRRAEKRSIRPRPQLPVLPHTTAAIRPPGSLRRSSSFAGWHSPAAHRDRAAEDGTSMKEIFDQLEDIRTWIEGWDGTPDSNEKLIG